MAITRTSGIPGIKKDLAERVLDAALRQLDSRGVEGMTIRSLAKEANVSPTTLFNRFGGKDNIIALVVIRNFESQIDVFLDSKNSRKKPITKLLDLIKLEQQAMLDKPKLAFALADMYFKQSNDRQLPDLLFSMMHDRILPILEQMEELGQLQSWVNLNLLAGDIADRFLSSVVKFSRDEIALEELDSQISRAVLSVLSGFATAAMQSDIQGRLKSATLHSSDYLSQTDYQSTAGEEHGRRA